MAQDIATRQLIVRLKCFQIPQAVSPETHQTSRLQLLVSNTIFFSSSFFFSTRVSSLSLLTYPHFTDEMNITSKQEVITEDEEMDINVDEDEPCDNYGSQSDGIGKISFSIAAILGESFGQNQKQMKIEPNQSPCDSTTKLFRPFDFTSFASNPLNISASRAFIANSPSAFFNNFRLSEIFDSTKYTHPHLNLNKSDNKQHNFTSKYHPKIHHHDDAQVQSRIAPLGGLSKTISQIGQETATTTTSNKVSNAKADINTKNQQPTNESIDSDSNDCNSEASTSTSKDEAKMWPAWVSEAILY